MENFGFIRDKLDIKILILFILQRLPETVDAETLANLVMCDDGVGYFDYAQALSELADTGHVEEPDGGYRITEKGIRNGSTIESSIAYSVRIKAERAAQAVAARMKRNAMIHTEHSLSAEGAVTVELGLADGVGDIAQLRLLVDSPEQAEKIEKNFRENAEKYYNSMIEMLTSD